MNKILCISALMLVPALYGMNSTTMASSKQARATKVAYVNIAKIIPSSEYGEAVNLDEGSHEWRDRTKADHEELQRRVQAMRTKAERLQKLSEELEPKKKAQWSSESTREQKTDEAMKLQSELEIDQQSLNRYVRPIQMMQSEMSPKIQKIVQEIAQQQGWDLVLFGGALYTSKEADITQEVITLLNKAYNAELSKAKTSNSTVTDTHKK